MAGGQKPELENGLTRTFMATSREGPRPCTLTALHAAQHRDRRGPWRPHRVPVGSMYPWQCGNT